MRGAWSKYAGSIAAVLFYFASGVSAQKVDDVTTKKLRDIESGISGIQSEIEKFQWATNCQKVSGERFGLRVGRDVSLRVFSYPDSAARSLELDVRKGTAIYPSGLAPDLDFECVLIGEKKIAGWVTKETWATIVKAAGATDRPLNDNFEAVAECVRGSEKGKSIVGSLQMFTGELNNYPGCSTKPELSYLVSDENQAEIDQRLTDYLLKAESVSCAKQLGSLLLGLGSKMAEVRKTFPNCGTRSTTPIRYVVIADRGLNFREFWIEAASSTIKGVVRVGARVQLFDRVGQWGYFKLPSPNADSYGWMHMRFVKIAE